jgi:hypothetical protein
MPELRVVAASWVLQLRWAARTLVPFIELEPSSILLEAACPVSLDVPGMQRFAGVQRLERSLPSPLLWETKALEVVWEHDEAGQALTLHHADPMLRGALRDASGRGRVLSGSLYLESRVGFLELDFRRGGVPVVRLRLEVFPSKLGFRRDFEQMLQELGGHRVPQVLRLLPPTSIARQLEHRGALTLPERYQVFDAFFEPIDQALRQVARQPHTGLARVTIPRAVDRLRRPDAATRRAARRAGGPQVHVGTHALPARLPDGHRETTFSTPANRFVARVLRSLSGLLSIVRAQRTPPWDEPQLRALVDERQRGLRRWLDQDFLRNLPDRVESPDLVVQRAPGYRDVLKWYRRTLLAFSVLAGDIRMGLKDLWYLYQLWCAVRVEQEATRLLGAGEGSLVPPSMYRPALGGRVVFADGTVLTAQHRSDSSLGSAVHQPDLLLELRRPAPRGAGEAGFQLVLDAKYRLDWSGGRAGPPQEALNAIHRYRDAVLTQGETRVERNVYGGVILFPHPDEETYGRSPSSAWHDFERMGVGAVPLVPGQGQLLRQWLAGLLHASDVRLDRLGPPYPALPPKRRSGTVMIAPLRYGDAQLAQMLNDGWYHLPTRWRLDSHRPTHLAPYEKGGQAAIRHLWNIEGWERVDDDRIAREAQFGGQRTGRSPPYWRVQLGAHVVLDPSIEGYDWGPRGPMFVPLEVFDLAESVFLLRGDVRHIELLRVLYHLRNGARSWESGWQVREPLVLNGLNLGMLVGTAEGIRWKIGSTEGAFSLDALERRTIEEVFSTLRGVLEAAVQQKGLA